MNDVILFPTPTELQEPAIEANFYDYLDEVTRSGPDGDETYPARFAAALAKTIDVTQRHFLRSQPYWWEVVLTSLHDRLKYLYRPVDKHGDLYLTFFERRTLANWLEHRAQSYRINTDGTVLKTTKAAHSEPVNGLA